MATTMTNAIPSQEQLLAMIAKLEAQNAELLKRKEHAVAMKVSPKGALSIYGLGRFPVTLYKGQWKRLIQVIPDVETFIAAHPELADKADATDEKVEPGTRMDLSGKGLLTPTA